MKRNVAELERMNGESSTGRAVHAAVDAGSNSVHLLVARVDGHGLEPILDESVFLGLASTVDATGFVGDERSEELVEVLADYVRRARALGAEGVVLLGTEPFRRAGDADAVAAAVEDASGVRFHVLDHEAEASLTAIGVTRGCGVMGAMLIVDIGGGSTEFISVSPDGSPEAWGIRLGSARLAGAVGAHDPPTRSEIAELRHLARSVLRDVAPVRMEEVTAVGGTAANLARVNEAASLDGYLTLERLDTTVTELLTEPAAVIAERFGLNPRRAPLLPAGAAIVEAILEWASVERVRAMDVGIREGAVLAVDRAGERWRERLPELVRGWE